ncbi:hypothetical protein E2C01_055994 [Portunus trituberculatus]|uniref:Uncharacterized protein n=1 Tax=Portunus trituberculatus TaxID=210409 RepID=A0A5B7GXS9_PORTR|nr:hypothetical protein [Portunus trituberculatus]
MTPLSLSTAHHSIVTVLPASFSPQQHHRRTAAFSQHLRDTAATSRLEPRNTLTTVSPQLNFHHSTKI